MSLHQKACRCLLHRLKEILSCLFIGQVKTFAPQNNRVPFWIILTGSKIVVKFPAMLLVHSDISCMKKMELNTLQHKLIVAVVMQSCKVPSRSSSAEAIDRGTLSVTDTCLRSAPMVSQIRIQGDSVL